MPLIASGRRYPGLASGLLARQQESLSLLLEKTYGITEVAVALGVHPGTVRAWVRASMVTATRTGPLGKFRISERELVRLKKGQGT